MTTYLTSFSVKFHENMKKSNIGKAKFYSFNMYLYCIFVAGAITLQYTLKSIQGTRKVKNT